jgi:hypothetical protein|tara:strand:- start:2645 stop:2797 length:153 start_codon:yes stop_codon:yes gene_type:complete
MTKQTKKMTIVTPMGSIESDSGNHFVDVLTILGFVVAIILMKKIISKYVK